MSPAFLAFLLLLLAAVLLFSEVFIPSGGILFLGSAVSLIIACWQAYQAWGNSSPLFWGFIVCSPLSLLFVVAYAFRIWAHTPMGKRFEPPTSDEVTPYQAEQARLGNWVGKVGETATPLNPAGIVLLGHERIHCFSEGLIVERGTKVRVLSVQGTRLLVRPVSMDYIPSDTTPEQELAGNEPDPLDFDLPPRPAEG